MTTTDADKGLLPAGLRDGLPPQAEWEAEITERLLDGFARFGYQRVKPPLIEFERSLLAQGGAALSPQMFRVMDPASQQMLGIRPDITLQVARIAETRLVGMARPLRLCYAGQVLRVRGSQLRPERQFAQAGAELIGAAELAADVEIVVMAARAVTGLGVNNPSLDLTQPMVVPAVCRDLGLDEAATEAVRLALDQKDAAALAAAAGKADPTLQRILASTGPADRALRALKTLDLKGDAAAMVAELAELAGRLKAAVPALPLTIDIGEVRNFEYHTGISFTLFARGVRGELGRGGRYMSAAEPATGVTLYLDSLLRALPSPAATKLLFLPAEAAPDEEAKRQAEGWRTLRGLKAGADIRAEAKRLGCTHVLAVGGIESVGAS